ncbi:MAG: hypothetical protein WDZ59_12505 [Pirellulales bacterium]
MVETLGKVDEAVQQVASALEEYERRNPSSECTVYRYNPAAIRIRIIDPAFEGVSRGDRHDIAVAALKGLTGRVISQISVLLCLAPGERHMLDMEFENPSRSYS